MYQNNNNSQTTVLFHLQHVHQHASLWRLDIKDFYRAARRAKIDKCAQHNSPRYHAALDFYQKLNLVKITQFYPNSPLGYSSFVL